jgi:beta-glucosidase
MFSQPQPQPSSHGHRNLFSKTIIRENSLARAGVMTILLGGMLALPAQGVFAQSATKADKEADALIAQMTLDEKIGQMTQVDMDALKKNMSDVQTYCFGSVLSGGSSDPADITAKGWLAATDEFQSYALKTRLKIPLLYGIDAVHGHNNVQGAVMFPHNVGLGATRNPKLIEKAARVTAEEVAGTGIRWAFSPCVAVAQNERWGRTYESYSENPGVCSELGAAAVRGLQGHKLSDEGSVLACAKHFLADGGTTDGIDQGNSVGDDARMRKLFLAPYVSAVKAGAGSIMVSYSSWNGLKMHANKDLLTGVLKGELGFKGFLISDWAAIDQITNDYKTAVEISINAGLDMIMIPNGPGQKNNYIDFMKDLKELVNEGKVPQSRIDDAVHRILREKYLLGIFGNTSTDPKLTEAVGSPAHRLVARECVRESLVLLKNSSQALPLSKRLKHIAVVGKGADDLGIQCGGWTIGWQGEAGQRVDGGTTILAGIRKAASARDVQVTYSANGTDLSGADEIIVVVGEQPYAEMKGDRHDLNLAADDAALIKKAKDAGVPVVTVLLSGRPLVLGSSLDISDAFVAAWLPGSEGEGVADVLFGDYKFKGKLSRTWPRSNEQILSPSAVVQTPQFAYGFGLSY